MPLSVENSSAEKLPLRAHILVVDDSAAARAQFSKLLVAAGMEVKEAGEGHEALRMVSATQFDLIVTDVHMPEMGGLALIREVRKLPNYASVPILVLTSDYSRERLKEGREVGASGWLIKPPQRDALVKTVRKALMQRK